MKVFEKMAHCLHDLNAFHGQEKERQAIQDMRDILNIIEREVFFDGMNQYRYKISLDISQARKNKIIFLTEVEVYDDYGTKVFQEKYDVTIYFVNEQEFYIHVMGFPLGKVYVYDFFEKQLRKEYNP